jgi:hypothetical protein
VAREESLSQTVSDLLDRAASSPGELARDDYEFSGTPYRLHAVALVSNANVRAFLFFTLKVDS